MLARKQLVTVVGAAVLSLLAVVSPKANFNASKTMYLTFNRPVSLPGVTLGSGTYIFELPDPDNAWTVVRVLSRDRSIVYFTAFTAVVNRPSGARAGSPVAFAEAAANQPLPISVWWPQDESTGRKFIYHQ
jgi:hypothetical protein